MSGDAASAVIGRVLDIDSHEMISTIHWVDEFGPETAALPDLWRLGPDEGQMGRTFRKTVADDDDIDSETIWTLKGAPAPSAIDLRRRPEALDALGIDRQLIFSTGVGLAGLIMSTGSLERVLGSKKAPGRVAEFSALIERDFGDIRGYGRTLCRAHNDWCARTSAISPRLRPVAVLDTSDLESAIAELERLVDHGCRAVLISSDTPPGGRSPAHADVDLLWDQFEQNNITVMLHVGQEWNFTKQFEVWSDGVPSFEGGGTPALKEAELNPYRFSTVHFAAQNLITVMVLGGVFERHPGLRLGVAELTAHWIGPMAENLQMWVDIFPGRARHLSMTPAEYLAQNVRVAPFYWEPVDKYIERFGLEDVYAYASDFPHVESGQGSSVNRFADRLAHLGPEVTEKFFVTNPSLLLPA